MVLVTVPRADGCAANACARCEQALTSRMLLLTLTLQLWAPFLLQPGLATCWSCWVNQCHAAPKHRGLRLAHRHCHV